MHKRNGVLLRSALSAAAVCAVLAMATSSGAASSRTAIDHDGSGNGANTREVDFDDQEAERRKGASLA